MTIDEILRTLDNPPATVKTREDFVKWAWNIVKDLGIMVTTRILSVGVVSFHTRPLVPQHLGNRWFWLWFQLGTCVLSFDAMPTVDTTTNEFQNMVDEMLRETLT